MDDTTALAALTTYRAAVYGCCTRRRDAVFDLGDALATQQGETSLVQVSRAPSYQRRFASVYQALGHGRLDQEALRAVHVRTAPRPAAGERLLLAVDASNVARPYARTSPDRTLVQVPAQGYVLPGGGTLARPGWAYSTVAVVPPVPSGWTHTLDTRRIPSAQTATTIGAAQLAALIPLLPARPLCLVDGGYCTRGWLQATAALPVDQLIRAAATRVLYRPAPARTGQRGRPCLDGARFKGSDPATQGRPDATGAQAMSMGRPSQCARGRICICAPPGTSRSQRCASPARRRPGAMTSGSGGSAVPSRPWPPCLASTPRASGSSMPSRWTKESCSGPSRIYVSPLL